MSNRKKLTKVKTAPTAMSIKLAELNLKLEGKGRVLDRRMRRQLRGTKPLAAFITDHSVPHARQEDCGPKCRISR